MYELSRFSHRRGEEFPPLEAQYVMKINMPHSPGGDSVDALVAQVVDCGAVMSQIVNHMVASQSSGRTAPDAPPIPVVLHELLRGVLEPLVKTLAPSKIRQTTTMLEAITKTISEEIFLVPLDDDDDHGDAWEEQLAS
jgi:hypothetical protein